MKYLVHTDHHSSLVVVLLACYCLVLLGILTQLSLAQSTWTHPSYKINTVNINAVITSNPHGEHISQYKGKPISLDFDSLNNMYILDSQRYLLKVNMSTGIMSTLMGSNPTYDPDTDGVEATRIPIGIATDIVVQKNGESFVVGGSKIKKVTTGGNISNYNIQPFDNINIGDGGKAIDAKIYKPDGMAVNSKEEIIFSDQNRIRKIHTNGTITTIAGDGNNGANTVAQPLQLCLDNSDNVIWVDKTTDRIKKLSSVNGVISVVAGAYGVGGTSPPDGSPANTTGISPISVAVRPSNGELYFATSLTISRIGADEKIYRVAGNGEGIGGSGEPAISTLFKSIVHISFGSDGNLYIVDHLRLRMITISNSTISTIHTETSAVTSIFHFNSDIYYTVGCQIRKIPNGVSASTTPFLGSRGSCIQGFGVPRKVDTSQSHLFIDTMTIFTLSRFSGRMYFSTEERKMWNITDGYIYPMVNSYGENIDIKDGLVGKYVGGCVDNMDNLIIGDNFRLRLINSTSRIVTTIAGGGSTDLAPFTCSVSSNGDIVFKEYQYFRKWSVSTGVISTIATGIADDRYLPHKVKFIGSGAVLYADNARVYRYFDGAYSVIAGGGQSFQEGGWATNVKQGSNLIGLTSNNKGEIFYVDFDKSADKYDMRKLTPFCIDPNTYLDSTGTKCLSISCFGVDFNNPSVCSGRGLCSSLDNCTCNAGSFGSECEKFTCFGFNITDPKVCSGTGTCTNLNTCSCTSGYQPECKDYTCYGYAMNDSRACSSHGSCTGVNKCDCLASGYYGNNCELFNCFNIPANITNTVCSGRGQCIAPDTCHCQLGFYPQCTMVSCFGKQYNDVTSCSSGGNCTSDNVCECVVGRSGVSCEYHTLSLNVQQGRPYLKSTYLDKLYPTTTIEDCTSIFRSTELKILGTDPLCTFSSSGLVIMLGAGFSIGNGTLIPTKQFDDSTRFNFRVSASGDTCNSWTQSSLSPNIQTSVLQNLNSDTVIRLSESEISQSLGRTVYWSGHFDFLPLISPNQKVVIIPKGYWKPTSLSLTISTSTLCGIDTVSRTFTFKTDTTPPFIDFMTDTPSSILNCVGYDCLIEYSLSPASTSYKPQIKFSGTYSTMVIQSSNLQIARLSNYFQGDYFPTLYSGTMTLELQAGEKQTITHGINYASFENSQLFINNLNRGFSKDQPTIVFDLTSQNPLLFTVNSSAYLYYWNIFSNKTSIATSTSSSIALSNPGVGDYSLSFQISNKDGFLETIQGVFSVLDVSGIPDITVESFTYPYPFIKTLDLTANINSSTSVRQVTWSLLSGSFYNSPILSNYVTTSSLGQNNVKTKLSIPASHLKEGSSYVFEVRVLNNQGINVQKINVKMDYNPRFSCDYFASYNSSELNIYDTKMILSCNSFEKNLAAYVIDLYNGNGDSKLMTLSNTVKSSVISRLPYSTTGLSYVVKAINRNGSYRQIIKPISGGPTNIPSNDISIRVSYIIQQWTTLKAENVKMDTASSILSLLTYLQNGKQTFEDFSILSDTTKQILTDVTIEMVSYLKSITAIGYRADDKIAAVLLSPTLKLVKLVKSVLPTVFTNQKSDIQFLIRFIVKGVESVTGYYTPTIVRALVDGATFNETVSLMQNVYTSIATSGLLGELTRLQLVCKQDNSLLNLVSYQSPQEISGKTIELSASIKFTFPMNFYSQLSSSVPINLISSQEQTNNNETASPIISISLFKSDGLAFKVQGLTSFIEIVFSDLDLKTENVSCVYFDEELSKWSSDGLITTVIKKISGVGYNVKCETNHLTAFSVIANTDTVVNPTNSSTNKPVTTDSTLSIALGVSIPVGLILIGIIIISIAVCLSCFRKKKSNSKQAQQIKRDSVIEQPSVSAYQPEKTTETLTDTELSDFPTNDSMLIKPLMSVYSSSSGSSTSSKFDPMSRYKNLVRIGQGGFGSVFKAEDSKCNNQLKALKVIRYSSVEELNTILKEGNRLMNISHPYILHVNDVLIDSEQVLCIDMDYYEKGDLNQFVKVGTECSETILKQILYQMCNALDYVHTTLQIIHRDIKPSNIFIKEISKESIHTILADFGLARQTQGSVMFSYAGTPLFMSTELALGSKYTANTDIYSLGVTLYQIITKDVETSLSHLSLTMDTLEFEKTIRNKMKEANSTLSNALLDVIISMLKRDYMTRPYPRDILENSYFQD